MTTLEDDFLDDLDDLDDIDDDNEGVEENDAQNDVVSIQSNDKLSSSSSSQLISSTIQSTSNNHSYNIDDNKAIKNEDKVNKASVKHDLLNTGKSN